MGELGQARRETALLWFVILDINEASRGRGGNANFFAQTR